MAFDAFLKIDGIDGECTEKDHDAWIGILNYKHRVFHDSSDTARANTRGASGGAANHGDFMIEKYLDKSSPLIAEYCCRGRSIPTVTLEIGEAMEDGSNIYMQYKLSNVVIASSAPEGSVSSGDPQPKETICFNYSKIEWTYTEYDHETQAKGGEVKAGWDCKTNRAV